MAGITVPPDVARLGLQAAEIRRRITAKIVAQQRLRAMMQAQQAAQQGGQPGGPIQQQVAPQGMPQPPQTQQDPYAQAQAMRDQAQDYMEEQRRQAMLDALQQKGSA